MKSAHVFCALAVLVVLSGCEDPGCSSATHEENVLAYGENVTVPAGGWTTLNSTVDPARSVESLYGGSLYGDFWFDGPSGGRLLVLDQDAFENWRYGLATSGGFVLTTERQRVGHFATNVYDPSDCGATKPCIVVFDNRDDPNHDTAARASVRVSWWVCR